MKATFTVTSPCLTDPNAVRSALAPVVKENAESVIRTMRELMNEPKHGRTYRRGALVRRASQTTRGLGLREKRTGSGNRLAIVGSRFHRASAPGEAPAADTGKAAASLVATVDGLTAHIEGAAELARLDAGTRKIAPRPLVAPALERVRPKFERDCEEALAKLV